MSNFYEIIDDMFNNILKKNNLKINDIIDIKSRIIEAYEYSSNKECDYINSTLSIKSFKLNEYGIIQKS